MTDGNAVNILYLQPFNLKRGELLQIANLTPAALVEVHLVGDCQPLLVLSS